MRQLLLIFFLLPLSCDIFAISEESKDPGGWVHRDGTPVPDADNIKSNKGFGGWVIVTPDKDWEEKWNTPTENTPHFNEASNVTYGDAVTILTFIVNPAVNANGEVNVLCDIQVVRPDDSFSIDAKEVECMVGELKGNPGNVRLTVPIIKFVGEKNDPPGEWKVKIMLVDKNRGAVIPLKTRFKLVQ